LFLKKFICGILILLLISLSSCILSNNDISDISPLEKFADKGKFKFDGNPISKDALEKFYGSTITLTTYEKLNDDMPEYKFDLQGYYDIDLGKYTLETLKITDTANNEIIQEIC